MLQAGNAVFYNVDNNKGKEMKRIYHPYWLWEDWKAGMWNQTTGEKRREMLEKAIEFTGNADLYGSWMMKVIDSWRYGCEHNLTERSMNRLAWIGHAAACMAIGATEDVTRQAWAFLSDKQREDADAKAKQALSVWIERHEKANQQLHLFVGT